MYDANEGTKHKEQARHTVQARWRINIAFLIIKTRGATAPTDCFVICVLEKQRFFSDDIFVGVLSSSFLEGRFLSLKTYLLRV